MPDATQAARVPPAESAGADTQTGAIESGERIQHLFQTIRDAVLVVDSQLRVVEWNSNADDLFDISQRPAEDRILSQVVRLSPYSPFAAESFYSLFSLNHELSSPCHFDAKLINRNGRSFPAEASVSGWKTGDSSTFSLFIRDVSLRHVEESARHEAETRDVVIFAMARLAESRDPETGAHIERVAAYCQALAERLAVTGPYQSEVDPEFVALMYATSPLHDIGKVGIPDDILLKPGRLSDREFEVMKMHAQIGAETLDAALLRFPNVRFLRIARNIAATHHERFDGTGYPQRLKGRDIPLCGRIAALADVYDALTSRRVYKAAMAHDVARGIIIKDSGTHFDPPIVAAFLEIETAFKEIHQRFSEKISAAA